MNNTIPSKSILIVEDDAPVRQLVVSMLQPMGCRVVACRDGDEAQSVAEREGPFDVLVTDVSLPDHSGPELVARLRGILPDMKVLFVSGYPNGEVLRRGETEAAFLAKPFKGTELRQRIVDMLRAPED